MTELINAIKAQMAAISADIDKENAKLLSSLRNSAKHTAKKA